MMTQTELTEQINVIINKALGANITVANIELALTNAVTALQATPPTLSHDRTIEDPGSALNPSQP